MDGMSTVLPSTSPSSASPGQSRSGFNARVQPRRREAIVRFLRKTHGWVGLWGAILGLLFGVAGVWLNHRSVLKLPMDQQRVNAQLALPDPAPADADAMAKWLQSTLDMKSAPNVTRVEPSRPVQWTEKGSGSAPLMQPERWVFSFGGPDAIVQADYWRGNRSVGVTTTANGVVATMTNLHKGTGMSVPWILLVDTLAGSIVFLSISGVLLWMLTHRRRRVGLAIFGTSVALTLGLIGSRIF